MIAAKISNAIHKKFKRTRRVAVVGYNDKAVELAEQLKLKANYSFLGYFYNYEPGLHLMKSEVLGPLDYCIDLAKEKKIKDFYISAPEIHQSKITHLAQQAEKHCIRVHFLASEKDPSTLQKQLNAGFYRMHNLNGLTIFKRYNEPLRHLKNVILKRCFDIVVSSFIVIFILSWLIPMVSLLIKLESRGRIFFIQQRSGRDNNSFWCLKFRSMIPNSLCDLVQATKGDNRITKMGAFLRRTNLDEFPQFLNVFKGEMSIVGPRPHMLKHTEEYSNQVEMYMARLYLKPGVTGWAQANGYRGEIKDIELMKKRVEHDIWYMENWSLWLDIKIMYLTVINVLKGEENAY